MTERTTILIVDDESKIRRLLSRSLETEGFDVAVADSAMSASEFLKNGHCDLIILDYMMPEIDGMAFLAELRKKSSIPVIMLSAREEIAKKTQALELGADDYVVKPFSVAELVARVDALYRRLGGDTLQAPAADPEVLTSGDFSLNLRSRELSKKGKKIEITQVEFLIIKTFLKNVGKAMSREELMKLVWGENYQGDPKIVDVNMRRLRVKIEDDAAQPRHIMTIWGYGYKWEG